MSDSPLVSILINNYNYGRFLGEAIDSALSQTYPNFEVIVVDDGSKDSSKDIISSYGDLIQPLIKENGGQASAFNAGFAVSKGEIISFLDSDDCFFSNKISSIVKVFEENQGIEWCFHPLQLGNEILDKIETPACPNKTGIYDVREKLKCGKLRGNLALERIATSSICLKREFLDRVLPMPEEIRITSDDYIKYAALGLSKGFILPDELAIQRIHGNNSYTTLRRNDKTSLKAKTALLTAYWLRTNFPSLSKVSNALFALGLSLDPDIVSSDPRISEIVSLYISTLGRLEKLLEVRSRATLLKLKKHFY